MDRKGRPRRPRSSEERQALLQRISSAFDLPAAILALIWVLVISVQLAGIVPPAWAPIVANIDTAIWLVFLAQFLLEFSIAPDKSDYLADNWIIALSVLLPFFGVLRLVRAVVALRSLCYASVELGDSP